MDTLERPSASLRGYLVGAYLFSVPAFAYSESLGLLYIPQILGALVVAYAILDILKNLRLEIPREIGLYGLMGLWAFVTYYLGSDINQFSTLSLSSLIKVVIATLACAQLIKNENDLFVALKIFVFSILFVFLQNIDELRYLRYSGVFAEVDRFAGTLANSNTAAVFALTVIGASLILLLHSREKLLWRVPFLIPVVISLIIVYFSGSKKGLIGLGLITLILTRLVYIRKNPTLIRKGFAILISISLLLIAGYLIYASPFFFRLKQSFSGGSSSDMLRVILMREAIDVWLMNWKTFFIGVGYANFRNFGSLQLYSHITPLEILAGNGIIGLSLFMGFLFLLFKKVYFLYRKTADQEYKGIYFASLIILFLYFFFMLSTVLQDSRELLPILGCLASFSEYRLRLFRQSLGNEIAP